MNRMDRYNLRRFVDAQAQNYCGYEQALREIRNGRKTGHWIWYIFPQLRALGHSPTALHFGISGLEEAREYLKVASLKENLLEICGALLELETCDAGYVMGGHPDDMKLKSSMTLFFEAAPEIDVFQKVLDKYFGGRQDQNTLRILGK